MNILPFVFLMILTFSILSIERFQKFSSVRLAQLTYETIFKQKKGRVFNWRQEALYKHSRASFRQLNFRVFLDKELREQTDPKLLKYNRIILLELLKELYQHTSFFKAIKDKRPAFLEELLEDIQNTADQLPKSTIKRIQDISRLELADKELQTVFYKMLKGTIPKERSEFSLPFHCDEPEKCYFSLLDFIHYRKEMKIKLRLAPRELLKAIYPEELVNAILEKRAFLKPKKNPDADKTFESLFKGNQREEIGDELLDFTLTSTNTTPYQ